MAVANEFEDNGFSVYQSTYYKDPESGKSREVDVVARKGVCTGNIFADIQFVIECKTSKEKPWIVFTRKNKIIDWEYMNWYCTSKLGWDYVLSASIDGKFDELSLTYHKRERIGYGITQAFTTGEGLSYRALQIIGNCAAAFADKANKKKFDVVEIIIPVIVIQSPIYEAHLDKGELVLEEVKESVVLWDTIIKEQVGISVHIVIYDNINNFAKLAGSTAEKLCQDWKQNLDSIIAEMAEIHAEIGIPN